MAFFPGRIFTSINKKPLYLLVFLFQIAQRLHRHSFIISHNISITFLARGQVLPLLNLDGVKASVFKCNLQKSTSRLKSKLLLLRNFLLGMFFSLFPFNLKYETVISVISYCSNFSSSDQGQKSPAVSGCIQESAWTHTAAYHAYLCCTSIRVNIRGMNY